MTSLSVWLLSICILHQLSRSQWTQMTDSLYSKQNYGSLYYQIESWYNQQNLTELSPFIACTLEAQSVIYLNGAEPTKSKAIRYLQFGSLPNAKAFITLDLYFAGTWNSGTVQLALGSWSTTITYTTPTTLPFTGGFCDSLSFDVQSYSFMLPPNQSGSFTIIITTSQGQVGVRNFHASYLRCHYSCRTCSGENDDQCLSCFSGIVVTSGKCTSCPQNTPYLDLYQGCRNYCDQSYIKDSNNVCQTFSEQWISYDYFSTSSQSSFQNYVRTWSQIYDPQLVDGTSKQNICSTYFYGPFTTRSGTSRSVNSPQSQRQYPVRIKLSLLILGQLQENSGIQVKINNQYVGSLTYFNSQFILDNVIVTQNISQTSVCMTYQSYSELILLFTIPAAPSEIVLFTIIGNLTQPTLEKWGIRSANILVGQCPNYCSVCDETNYCITCQSTIYTLNRGKCYFQYYCPSSIGFVNSSNQCEVYASQPYSNAVFQGFYDFMPFEGMDSVFTVLNQTGTNFMKGPNKYTSFTFSKRIFGGPFIWAQAAFKRIFSLPNPHYAASVHFKIIFGSNFTVGNFSYQIESNDVKTLGKPNCTQTQNLIGDTNLEYIYQVKELLSVHNTNTLELIFHCYGDSNSVQYAYCGIQDLFIVEHQCQPYCLACTSPTVCTSWNATYDSSIIKFDESTCLSNQYQSRLQYQCFDCPLQCATCRTFEQCTSCISTFTLFNYQCLCQITEYLDTPIQCLNCQQPCLTCSSLNYCTDCHSSQIRVLRNGVCECATNYYEVPGNFVCQPCNQYCTTCNGPDNGQCTACILLTNFILDGNTCRCQDNFYYSQTSKICESCHYSCQTCYNNQENNCLSCLLGNHRILVGLKCPCEIGFYEASSSASTCSACPASIDAALLDCNKLCGDGSTVWHNIICPAITCFVGFQNQSNQCIPICGDGLVVLGEDCDDMNSIQLDGCHNCGFQCNPICLTCDAAITFPCSDICGDGIVSGTEECEDGNDTPHDGCYNCLYQCQPECTKCIKGLCYECSTYGWKVNTIDLTCIENCGDSIVVNREQCDDYNTNPEDGCHNCRYQCRSDCLECNSIGNICLKCQPGFVPVSYYCKNICGDGKIVSSTFFTEQCDDFNTINYDGCSSTCQFQCQPSTICLTCDAQQKCQSCAPEYQLNQQKNKCEEICGDNLLVGTENCEDLNNIMYDGCYKCRYQCQIECANCSQGVCIQCKTGYFLNKFNQQCSPICGDKLVVTPEQCDDGNLVFDDGCHNCQFNCQDSCSHCLNGKCYTCKEGYYLNSISQCKPICGDNIIIPNEECEDLDQSLKDNCQNCKLICSLYCQQCFYGVCLQCQPQFELDPVSNKCFPSILYSESVKENCISNFQNECLECADSWSLNSIYNECMLVVEQNQNCQIGCQICSFGKCINCEFGYLYDDFASSCLNVCGDGIITVNEECDSSDENCINCQLSCIEQCVVCLKGKCLQCQEGWILDDINKICLEIKGDNLLVGSEKCDVDQYQFMNQWLINFEFQDKCMECEQNCAICTNGHCNQCDAGYYVSNLNSRCESKCGDLIKTIDEQCDTSSNYCYQCLLICDIGCQICNESECILCNQGFHLNFAGKCQPICGDGVLVENELMDNINTNNCYQCPSNCQLCFNNHCQQCEYGYYLNAYDFNCQSSCGDSIVSGDEQCDQGFDNNYCVQCKIKCQMSCIQCVDGKCLQCSQGWTLNLQNNKCYETKYDWIEIGQEICDSGTNPLNISNDSCHQCDGDCFNCINRKCQQCQPGYYLERFSNKCNSKCGDNIQVSSEECDNWNDIHCLSCQYICLNCLQCHKGICYECQLGWYLNNAECSPVLGDGLLVGFEVCDNASIQVAHSVKYIGVSLCFQCDDNCQICNDNDGHCIECQQGYYLESFDNTCQSICGDNIQTRNEECDNHHSNCLNCRLNCSSHCHSCVFGICLNCQVGWRLDATNECQPIQNDGLVVGNEKCGLNGHQPQFLQICQECSENCIYCDAFSQCQQCEVGYQLNSFTNSCYSICGDGIITQNEECDDGNPISIDGCHDCKYQCSDGCEHCSQGQCLKCQLGWVLNEVDFTCFTICGDGEVGGLEFCDDGNDIPLDGCYECLYQCQLECLVCEYGKCYSCDSTLELIVATHNCQTFQSCDPTNGIYLDQFDNQCKSHCGDQIKALEEECDDGNSIPYDGCDKCLFSCDPLCTDCIEGVCLKCQTGYKVIDQKCKGVCGDGIQLFGSEECDDSNLIPRDGCTACKIDPSYECILQEMGPSICYTCPKNCQMCDQFRCKKCKASYFMNQGLCQSCADKCEECEGTPNNCISCVFEGCQLCESKPGYYTNLEEKSCYSKCGDNVVSQGEQCDDGNSRQNDGCDSQCQLEGRFKCGDSGCAEIPLPVISIEYKNSTTTNDLYFQISDTFKAGFCGNITVWIENFEKENYNITITEDTLTNQCEFLFLFQKTIEEINLIHVIVPIFDGERRLLAYDTREIIIKPRKQVYYSESQLAQAQSVVAASESLMLILKLVGPMTIILGGFNFFWTILDILTWINNFYFINVYYPENVRMFFQQLEWGDLFMIPSIITLNSEEDDYYFMAPPKFVEKDVDPLFANNIELFLCLVALSFLGYLISGYILRWVNKCYTTKKQTKQLSFYNLQNNKTSKRKVVLFNQQKVPYLITKLQKECQYFNSNYRAILMQILGLVFLDLCLASILQLTNTSTQEFWIVKVNIIIAWLNLILIGYIFYLNYKISNSHQTLLKNKSFICIFGSLYEGINIKSSISRTYAFVNLIRKCLFIFFTVYYYDVPILQTSTCCVACFLNIALLCYQNPFESKQLLIQNGLPDFCIFCILLITVGFAVDDKIKFLSSETTFQIGWVILSFIGISILTQLIFLFREFYQNIKIRLKMIKNLICPASKQ